MSGSEVYRYPRYYAIGYRWNTEAECDFIEACLKTHGPTGAKRLLDIGCGSGRHLTVLAKRGYHVSGVDLSPEMIAYVEQEAKDANLPITAAVDDLRRLKVKGTYDVACCFMDTFRFLLTNEEITAHLRAVAKLLAPGGLYLTDFWVPCQWDKIGGEIHQWEQTEGDVTVRVFYLQHPDSIDPIQQTFEDELVFEVREGGCTREIRGGPTRTRLLLPQECRALVNGSGAFTLLASYGEFDLAKPFDHDSLSWRMISVLKKRVP
ncbi:MAG: class I SAM-dependent methyltransferase [Candidatus Omnitrophica bacterium]|nr:class I SAM-dependent methyltransferase [Candidatus Omnitrophota bacterium]